MAIIEKKEITSGLFLTKSKVIAIGGTTIKVGTRYVPNICSQYNNSDKVAKASKVGLALEYLLSGKIKVLIGRQNENSAFISYKKSDGTVLLFSISETMNTIICSGDSSSVDLSVIYSVLLLCKYDEERKACIANIINSFNNLGSGSIPDIYVLCDNAYHSYFKNITGKITIEDNRETLLEEIKQAVRNQSYVAPYFLSFIPDCEKIPNLNVILESKKSVKKEEQLDAFAILENAKNGDYKVNYDFGENSEYIPDVACLDMFIPDRHFVPVFLKFKKKIERIQTRLDMGKTGREAIGHDYVNIELTGKPGTGKTTLAEVISAIFGLPLFVSKNSNDTEDDEMEGKTKIVEGNFKLVDTSFVRGFSGGGIIVDEEYNLTRAGIKMGAIGQAIEAPFILKRNGFEDIIRHPFCFYIATSNANTQGTQETNEAFSSRCKCAYALDDPDDATFIKRLMIWDDEFEETDCIKVLDAYKKINNYLNSPKVNAGEITLAITIRQCIGALESITEGNDFKYAIETSMIGKIYQRNPELAEDVKEAILKNLRE